MAPKQNGAVIHCRVRMCNSHTRFFITKKRKKVREGLARALGMTRKTLILRDTVPTAVRLRYWLTDKHQPGSTFPPTPRRANQRTLKTIRMLVLQTFQALSYDIAHRTEENHSRGKQKQGTPRVCGDSGGGGRGAAAPRKRPKR